MRSDRRDAHAETLAAELAAIVGEAHVLTDADACALHSRTTEPQTRLCAAVVRPGSVDEVRAVMQAAQRHRVPVWPFSRGNNWGYGTRNALHDGAVVMLLERMDRIVAFDPKLAYVVVEPGVTQQQLHDFLLEQGGELMADCTDATPLGSVLGNAIERGYGYTPYGDHFAHVCGLEVVLPDGEVLRTGTPLEKCPTRHTHRWGSGPVLEGLFSQGNLGIVVRAGIWLHPRPREVMLFTLDVDGADCLHRAIDALRELALAGTLQSHVHSANAFQTLSLVSRYPEDLRRTGAPIPGPRLQEMRRALGIAEWSAVGGIYGTRAQVRVRQREIARRLRDCGALGFFDERDVVRSARLVALWRRCGGRGLLGAVAHAVKRQVTRKDFSLVALLPEMYGVLQGRPTWAVLRSAYFKSAGPLPEPPLDPARDGCGLMWLAPAVPMTGAHARAALALVAPFYDEHGFNLSACLTMMNQRTLFLLLGIFFDPQYAGERERAAALYRALHAALAEHGYQHYRAGIPAWSCSAPGSDAGARLLAGIKARLDPSDILAPGRYSM
jgi:4-cresol dehydrogenase (hydroxylating)